MTCAYCQSAIVDDGGRLRTAGIVGPRSLVCPKNRLGHDTEIAPNCMMGYPVHNRHGNCPYSMLCATCDMSED